MSRRALRHSRTARARRTRAWLLAAVLVAVVVVGGGVWGLTSRGDGAPVAASSAATPTSRTTTSPSATPGGETPPPSGPGATPGTTDRPAGPDLCTPEEPCLDPAPTVPPAPPAGGGRADVAVTVTSWGWDAAAASAWLAGFVGGVEEDATCTASFERDGETVVVEAAGAPDAATTVCAVTVPGSRLASGTWTATLEFVSAARSGTSAPVTMEIP